MSYLDGRGSLDPAPCLTAIEEFTSAAKVITVDQLELAKESGFATIDEAFTVSQGLALVLQTEDAVAEGALLLGSTSTCQSY